MKSKNKDRGVNGGLDQYYTPENIAIEFLNKTIEVFGNTPFYLEPSAGAGVFLNLALANGLQAVGLDIAPACSNVVQQDFLTYEPTEKNIVTFGNPPFGFIGSLALKFFNRAACFSNGVAFILPATFSKHSKMKSLDKHFELVWSREENIQFILPNGNFKKVPCVMQIWKRLPNGEVRNISKFDVGKDIIKYVKHQEDADICIKRVGRNAGKVFPMEVKHNPLSTYFIKAEPHIIELLQKIDVSEVVGKTAGVRSLSKAEIALMIRKLLSEGEK